MLFLSLTLPHSLKSTHVRTHARAHTHNHTDNAADQIGSRREWGKDTDWQPTSFMEISIQTSILLRGNGALHAMLVARTLVISHFIQVFCFSIPSLILHQHVYPLSNTLHSALFLCKEIF